MPTQTSPSVVDARADAAARDVATRYCRDEMSEASARSTMIELALSSPITDAASATVLNRLGSCNTLHRRREITSDVMSDILIRSIVGTADSPPLLALNQIANGVRFTTWLRRLLYGRSMDFACSRVYAKERHLDESFHLDDEELDGTAYATDIERDNIEVLWQQFLGEKDVTPGRDRPFLDEWVLAELLGVRPLSRPVPSVQQALVDVPVSDVRDALKDVLSSGDYDPRLSEALLAMVSGHDESERRELLSIPDVALDRLITAALTPHRAIGTKDLRTLREVALDHARRNSTPSPSASSKNVTGMVSAWNVARAATVVHRGKIVFKEPGRRDMEREAFCASVRMAVRHGFTAFGTTPDQVDANLERLYASMTNERRRSHIAA